MAAKASRDTLTHFDSTINSVWLIDHITSRQQTQTHTTPFRPSRSTTTAPPQIPRHRLLIILTELSGSTRTCVSNTSHISRVSEADLQPDGSSCSSHSLQSAGGFHHPAPCLVTSLCHTELGLITSPGGTTWSSFFSILTLTSRQSLT